MNLLLSALFFLVCLAAPLAAQSGKTLDKIVAVVGNEIITQSELDLQLLRLGMRSKIDMKDQALRRRVLDDLVNNKLVLVQAMLDSIDVSEENVTAQVNEQIRMLEQNYGSTAKLEEVAGMTVSQLRRDFREDARKALLVEGLQREKFGSLTVSNREVDEFFRTFKDSLPQIGEQVQLSVISLHPRVTEQFLASARSRAERLLDSLRLGADFAALARQHSDDPGSARNGGDLGLARRGVFVKEFEEAAFNLKPGELSGVIESPFGFHIIKLLERKGEAIQVAHILIRIEKTGESDTAVMDTLARLRERILAGEDFAALARRYSEDPRSRNFGGDMGLVEVSQLGSELKLIQQNLSVGEISKPTRIPMERDYAFAIVRLDRRIPPHHPNLTDDYQRIMNLARIYKQNTQYVQWIQSIKETVYWKILL